MTEPEALDERSARKSALGSGHLAQALFHHLEDAHLVGGAEAVLGGADDAERVAAVALERQHGVHQVLEQLGARDGAVFGDVANQDEADALLLGQLHQPRRDLAQLRDAAR
jgi:hypothetical protein